MEKIFMKKLKMAILALAAMNIIACGNRENNNNPAATPYNPQPGQVCNPGQACTLPGGALGGVALLNGPAVSQLDNQGSGMTLTIAAQGPAQGSLYNGNVIVDGTIHLAAGACMGNPVSDFHFRGQGNWMSGYAGSVGRLDGQLTIDGGGIQNGVPGGQSLVISGGLIHSGQDPNNPTLAGFVNYLEGFVTVGFCGRTFVAL